MKPKTMSCNSVEPQQIISATTKSGSPKTSSIQRRPRLAVSALSNWAALAVHTLISFLLTPYLIHKLGKTDFGTWALVWSFVGYYGILRLGVGSGIMRYVPFYMGRNDHKAASQTISSGLAMFLTAGFVILVVSFLMARPIAHFYKAGPTLAALVCLTGLAAAIECPTRILDAALKAREKWLVVNSAAIATALLHAVGLAGCLYLGYGLVAMGYIVLAETILSLVLISTIFTKLCPTIRLRPSMVALPRVRELLSFGMLTTIATVACSSALQTHRLIIGKLVSLEAVGIYAVAAVLIDRVRNIVWAPLQVSWPRFALLDGQNNHQEVSQLFRRLTRYSNLLASGIILLVLVAGPPFISLWVGEGFDAAHPVLLILGIGCLVETSLYATSLLLGSTGHQGAQALFAAVEGILGVTLSILLGRRMGLPGVAIGYTFAVTLIRGLVCPWYVCHLQRISVPRYYAECLLRPWVITGFLAILAYGTGISEHINDWFFWIISVIAIGGLYALCAFVIALNLEEKKQVLSIVRELATRIFIPAGIKG